MFRIPARAAFICAAAIAASTWLGAQAPAPKPPDDTVLHSSNGQPYRRLANQTAWRRGATAFQAPSGTAIDEVRGRYSDQWFSSPYALDSPQGAGGAGVAGDSAGDPPPELVLPQDAVVVLASFQSAFAVLSPSRHSIYTVLQFEISKVLAPGPNGATAVGKLAQVIQPGGAIRFADGHVTNMRANLDDLGPQPGHRYVLVLQYFPDGNFFRISTDCEIRGGIAIPDNRQDNRRARSGESDFAGKSESQVLEILLQRLAKRGGDPQ